MVGHDPGDQGYFFAGGADAGDAGILTVFGHQHIFGFVAIFTPDRMGILDLSLAVIKQQIYRFRRNTGEKYTVKTGKFKVGTEITAGIGFTPATGQRRFGNNHIA